MTIKINSEIVEQLEASHDKVRYIEPIFSHHDKLKEYVGFLEHEEEESRPHMVTEWVSSVLQPVLSVWSNKYSMNTQLIDGAKKERLNLDKSRRELESLTEENRESVENLKEEVNVYENETHELDQKSVNHGKHDLSSLKMSVIIFLVFSVLVSIGTYVYFLQSQSTLYWATLDDNSKVTIAKQLITSGDSYFISAFKSEVEDDENVRIEDIADAVEQSNIHRAPSVLTVSQYLDINTIGYVMGFTSFLLLLGGKAIAIVYEKLHNPNWMFFLFVGITIILILSTIYSLASLQEKEANLKNVKEEIIKYNYKIEDEKEEPDFGGSITQEQELSPKIMEYKNKLNEKNKEYSELKKTFSSDKMVSFMLFLITELVVGAISWMRHSEYIEKKQESESGFDGQITVIKNRISSNLERIKMLIKDKSNAESEVIKATDLIHRLDAMLSDLPSKQKIDQFSKHFMDSEQMFAKQILQQKIHEWR